MCDTADAVEDRTVRLRATSFCNAAGMLAWAQAGYETELRRGGKVGPYIGVFSDGYRLGAVLAESVLRCETDVVVEGEDVVLKLSEDEFRLYRAANPKAIHDLIAAD